MFYYKGKWHISLEDIDVPGTNNAILSTDIPSGLPNARISDIYSQNDLLKKYGFNSWIGPDLHSGNPYNTGAVAPTGVGGWDIIFTQQVVDLLSDLNCKNHRG